MSEEVVNAVVSDSANSEIMLWVFIFIVPNRKKKSVGSYTTSVIFWVYIFIAKTSPKYVFAYEFKVMATSEHLKIKKNEE